VTLQKRVRILERLVRHGEKSKALQLEVSSLKEKLESFQDARALHSHNRELELENLNLRNRVSHLEQLLQVLGTFMPASLDRTFSTFEFV